PAAPSAGCRCERCSPACCLWRSSAMSSTGCSWPSRTACSPGTTATPSSSATESTLVRSIEANGCSFACELQGQGPDVVFIHGEIHGISYWEYQLPEFARDYRCFAYNRRGHAGTELTEFGFSLVNQTRDLAALIDKIGLQNPV